MGTLILINFLRILYNLKVLDLYYHPPKFNNIPDLNFLRRKGLNPIHWLFGISYYLPYLALIVFNIIFEVGD